MKKFIVPISFISIALILNVLGQRSSPLSNSGGGSVTGNNPVVTANQISGYGSSEGTYMDLTGQGLGGFYFGDGSASGGFNFNSGGGPFRFTGVGATINAGSGTVSIGGSGGVNITSGTFSPISINYSVAFTSTSITLNNNYYIVAVTATGQIITLPTAVGIAGRTYIIKLKASGSCTVNTTSSQTIDGSTTYSLSAQYKYVVVTSDGANWMIIGNN